MNKYTVKARKRNQSLLIVEGNHEKNQLFWLIFKCFPELNIDMNDVWIYGTNIYRLYEDITKEYGDTWADDEIDIDLPFVISKKTNPEDIRYKNDFTNIILIFDYERHDTYFSEQKILDMQRIFEDSADMGKLYLNYPMIESYLHLKTTPDAEYLKRRIPVTMQPGSQYKERVSNESCIERAVEFPHRLDDLLADDRYQVTNQNLRQTCCTAILGLSDNNPDGIEDALQVAGDIENKRTLKYQLHDWMMKVGYASEGLNYWEYMRKILQSVVHHNALKAFRIEYEDSEAVNANDISGNAARKVFDKLDLSEILLIQNNFSRDSEKGFIWVLSTCMFIIPDYNINLLD